MFEIKIADADVTNGTVSVSWCLDLETVKLLGDKECKDPQVVIVVAPDGDAYNKKKEYRRVVPLKDLMAYVEFRVPRTNKIWAFVSEKSHKDAKSKYLSKEDGEYTTDILNSHGDGWGYLFSYDNERNDRWPQIGSEPLKVEVPNLVFAPEPSDWEKSWVNHFFRDKCVDQCEFRRRRLFAYTLQVLIMTVQMVLRGAALLFALAVGAKGTSFQPFLHPLSYSMKDAFGIISGGSIFIRHVPEDDKYAWDPENGWQLISYVVRKLWTLLFMPPVLALLVLMVLFHHTLFVLSTAAVVIGILCVLAFLITGSGKVLWDALLDKLQGPEEIWYEDQEEIDFLTCNPDKKALTFKSLPKEKKTLRLRFHNLKSKVCRPFSA